MKHEFFKSKEKNIRLPVFFPDATRAVIRTLDQTDIANTHTPGILVNTWHLYRELGKDIFKKVNGVREFMNWNGGLISDSGGFQVMSIAKKDSKKKAVTDIGVTFRLSRNKKVLFTPEKSIQFQMLIKPDMAVVLDDFTDPEATEKSARETVERTILWAKKSKDEFDRQCTRLKLSEDNKPYLLAVVQGGEFLDLRKECTQRLVEIGFDGLGYGGWPIDKDNNFNYQVAKVIAENAPENYLLYGLGVGKPDEIVGCVKLGYQIFDCVLPTRDARHKRLYVYNADTINNIDVHAENFYSYYVPDKEKHFKDLSPVSTACDCLLCTKYSRSYLAHLFRIKEQSALRLSTIHNLRFYSILMEKLQQ
ncbi:queuine tRNA-ribosyltransferase family protein [Candidatus Woesebacteria bacterium]|nr:MAG: queuine tRNA-ribosyltransferase family protein [Candidatus Woesebacteria bacterium]